MSTLALFAVGLGLAGTGASLYQLGKAFGWWARPTTPTTTYGEPYLTDGRMVSNEGDQAADWWLDKQRNQDASARLATERQARADAEEAADEHDRWTNPDRWMDRGEMHPPGWSDYNQYISHPDAHHPHSDTLDGPAQSDCWLSDDEIHRHEEQISWSHNDEDN